MTPLQPLAGPLEPDRDHIEKFVGALFRHASSGFVSIRSFLEKEDKVFRISSAPAGNLPFLVEVARDDARRAAQNFAPVVFCPPIATFASKDKAREEDLVEGLALSVECDQHPQEARAKLEELLGPATVVVASGGIWTNGGSEQEDKLHLHWRLKTPARGKDALGWLKEARTLATRLVGGDASNKPIVHPIRWPGSWHRKAEPRLCAIDTVDPNVELDLGEALDKLRAVVPPAATTDDDVEDDSPSWDETVSNIINGKNCHQALRSLAARCAVSEMPIGQTINLMRSCMLAAVVPHNDDWQRRFKRIPRLAKTAYEKFGDAPQETPILSEWDAGDDPGRIDPRQWLLGNQFCRTFISSIVAAGGTGKSALRLLQFISLALGRSLCGQHVFRRCRVLLISLEDDRNELQRRIEAVLKHFGIARSELKGWLFCINPKRAKLAVLKGHKRVTGPLAQYIRGAVERLKPDLISLDPFVKTHGLEENASGDMDFVVSLLDAIAVEFNIAVDAPHHVHKGTITPGDADAGRGSTGIRDGGRLVYTLCPMSEDEAETFGVPLENRYAFVRLDPAKVNLVARGGKAEWFRLVGVPIGNATKEYPHGDTIQVAEPWTPPETWANLSNIQLNAALDDIDRGMDNGQRYSGANAAKERAAWPIVQRHCPAKSEAQCREIIKTWLATGLLRETEYEDPVRRDPRKGLRVEASKRPA